MDRPRICGLSRDVLAIRIHTQLFHRFAVPSAQTGTMPSPALELTPEERETLAVWSTTQDGSNNARALRASIILAVADGVDIHAIARRLSIQPRTARKWQRRFVQERLRGLDDCARSGAPRRIAPERIADLVHRTRAPTPREAHPWSRRMMAHATGLSRSTVHRLWNTLGIAPNRHTRT